MMRHPAWAACIAGALLFSCVCVFAAGDFKASNPDGNKYEFARSFIAALSNLRGIDQRWFENPPKKIFPKDDLKIIRASTGYLVLDNTDLRIAKNYMVKYLDSPNSLMRKAADMFILACNNQIGVNNKEKELWEGWHALKSSGKATPPDERAFVRAQEVLGYARKETDKNIISASLMMARVLLSENNLDEKGRLLAITEKERTKLVKRLDTFGNDILDWGMKPGQKTLEASIAVIREVLEDPLYKSSDHRE